MQWLIDNNVKVDAIITDPPYQTTACAWDTLIPFNKHIITTRGRSKNLIPMYEDEWVMRELETTDKSIHQCREEFEENCKEGMWNKLNKLIKPNGAIVLFGSEPFSSALRMSNIKNYKYDWVWVRSNVSNSLNAKKMPLRQSENISVFYKNQSCYNYLDILSDKRKDQIRYNNIPRKDNNQPKTTGIVAKNKNRFDNRSIPLDKDYPRNLLYFSLPSANKGRFHPTQKPIALIEYLIKTYTTEGELVLDFTSGSGTTAVACESTNRRWICIEKEEKYCEIHKNRMEGK